MFDSGDLRRVVVKVQGFVHRSLFLGRYTLADLLQGRSEVPERLTQTTAKVGQSLWSEDQQGDQGDDDQVRRG